MKLYGYPTFNSQKIALAMAELGLEDERIKVDLGRGEHKTAEFAEINPNQRVPVLVDGDMTLWESNAILGYLGEREGRLWPSSPKGKAEALRWLFYEGSTIAPNAGPLWFNDVIVPRINGTRDEELVKACTKKLTPAIEILEEHLQRNDWFLGREYSLVDASYTPVLGALNMSAFPLLSYPGIQAYLQLVKERDSWVHLRRF